MKNYITDRNFYCFSLCFSKTEQVAWLFFYMQESCFFFLHNYVLVQLLYFNRLLKRNWKIYDSESLFGNFREERNVKVALNIHFGIFNLQKAF